MFFGKRTKAVLEKSKKGQSFADSDDSLEKNDMAAIMLSAMLIFLPIILLLFAVAWLLM